MIKSAFQKISSHLFHKKSQHISTAALRAEHELVHYASQFKVSPDNNESIDTWKMFCTNVSKHIVNGDLKRFLQWPEIKGAMFVSNSKFAKSEFSVLRQSKEWGVRWHKASREVSLGHPQVFVKDLGTSGNLIHHTYLVSRLEDTLKNQVNHFNYVFEFGGGYGDMAKLFGNLGFGGLYTIFDFELFSRLQNWYLSCLGCDTSIDSPVLIAETDTPCVQLVYDEALLSQVSDAALKNKSLFIATWSFSETPIEFRDRFERLISDFQCVLITYQHTIEDIDNVTYFNTLQENLSDHEWLRVELPFQPTSEMLIGMRTKVL